MTTTASTAEAMESAPPLPSGGAGGGLARASSNAANTQTNPLRRLCDSPTQPWRWDALPLTTALWRTLRYAAAGRGIPLTGNERKLLALRDAHRGQRCFILGNGPSLNACDLTPLADEVTFGVNSIFLNREAMGFDPTYYVVEDILVAEDRAAQIDAYHGPRVKFFGNYLRRFLRGDAKTAWLNVMVDYRAYPGFPRFTPNAARRLWCGGTVSYLCLQLAFHMGFDEVYLVGFDHNYTIPDSAQREGNRITSVEADPNHFHGDYFGKGYRWHNPRVDRMEIAYVRAKQAFEAAGRTVFNATVGGKLEVFPRVDYPTLFDDPPE